MDVIDNSCPTSLTNLEADSAGGERHRILIIEQDSEAAQDLSGKLSEAGFAVSTLNQGEYALAAIERNYPKLVILDWDLPGIVTMDLLHHIRCQTSATAPRLIALSTFSGEQQVVAALDLGLDDYVVKPFSVREVIARVRAVLRSFRMSEDPSEYVEFRQLRMDAGEGRVIVRDRTVSLRTMEFRLLEFLMRHPERAFQRDYLLQRVWGYDCRADLRAVDVTIQRVRRALAAHACAHYLQTVRGVGYRISASGEPA